MAVDFDKTVLASCMDAFAITVTIDPIASQPGEPAYSARGVFDRPYEQVITAEGHSQTSTQPVLGIRLSEFAVPPAKKDKVTVDGVIYQVFDIHPDGQGGADLMLKEWRA